MDEVELKSVLSSEIRDAIGYHSEDSIVAERTENLSFYHGDKFGNEKDGRSQVVLRDVADTIEAALPSLIKIFASGDNLGEFQPEGPEDEEYAEQATDYCSYIFYRDNPGFEILYTWFKDALLSKNAVVKVWWDERKRTRTRTFTDLDDEAYTALVVDDDIEVLEHTEESEEVVVETAEGPYVQAITSHDVKIKKTETEGRVAIEPLPPEEFLISRRAKSIEDAPFVGHRMRKTKSDLIAMGYDAEVVEALPADDELYGNEEVEERFDDEDVGRQSVNKMLREVTVVEGYIRVDMDGDGIAELRKIVVAGVNADHILENEEVDDNPFESLCPIPLPHKFFGTCPADLVKDIQLIRSTLVRQMLDNLYLTNYPQREVVKNQLEQGAMDALLNVKPGAPVPVKGANAIRDMAIPFTAGQSFPMLEFFDQVKKERTGVEQQMGLDPEVLQNQSATAASLANAARGERLELIARVFAETGVRGLMRKILRLVVANQDKERVIRLRNEWVPMDPTDWNADMDVRINVGLGYGNDAQKMAFLGQVLSMQKDSMAAGLPMVSMDELHNTAEEIVKVAGLGSVDRYFKNPQALQQAPQQPPKPDPEMMKLKMEDERKREQMAREFDLSVMELKMKDARERDKMRIEAGLEARGQNMDAASTVRFGGAVG